MSLSTQGRELLAHCLEHRTLRRPDRRYERNTVEIPKDKILDLLREQGKSDQFEQSASSTRRSATRRG